MKRQTFVIALMFLCVPFVSADQRAIDPTNLTYVDPFPLAPLIEVDPLEGVEPSTKFMVPMGGELSKFFDVYEVTALNKNRVVYLVEARSVCSSYEACNTMKKQVISILEKRYQSSEEADRTGAYHVKGTNIYYRVKSVIQSLSPYHSVHMQIYNRTIGDEAIIELENRLKKTWSR